MYKQLLITIFTLCFHYYSNAQSFVIPAIHSHNDYQQSLPLLNALTKNVKSIEVDIFEQNGKLFVAHDPSGLEQAQLFEEQYIQPLLDQLEQLSHTYLLLDIKHSAKIVLPQLEEIINEHPKLFSPEKIQIIISGDIPPPNDFSNYNNKILFDGRVNQKYTDEQLERIPLVSMNFKDISVWNGKGRPTTQDHIAITNIIESLHQQNMKVRFWNTPDTPSAWQYFVKNNIDFINTDRINEVHHFLANYHKNYFQNKQPHFVYQPKNKKFSTKPKKILFLLGDGMGLAHIKAAKSVNNNRLNMFNINNISFIETHSSDDYTTDSASAASAFATGYKHPNRAISQIGDTHSNSLFERLNHKKDNMLFGIMTNVEFYDATPSAFFAHAKDRSNTDAIIEQVNPKLIDLLIGTNDNPTAAKKEFWLKKGFYSNMDITEETRITYPFFGQIAYKSNYKKQYPQLFHSVLQKLDQSNKNFFLLCEGGRIDVGGHWNDARELVQQTLYFDQIVGYSLAYADKHEDTLVVVIADHETGGVSIIDSNIEENSVLLNFSTNDHTGIMIPAFFYGAGAQSFNKSLYSNNEIFNIIHQLIK